MAAKLYKFFSPPDGPDPEMLLSGTTAMFSAYPQEVVEAVCDPVWGLPSTSKWAPKLAEIRTALEIEMVPVRNQRERDAIAAEAARSLPPPIEDRATRKTYAQLQAELAEAGIFIGTDGKHAKALNVNEFREKHGVSKAQWDAIPDAPKAP